MLISQRHVTPDPHAGLDAVYSRYVPVTSTEQDEKPAAASAQSNADEQYPSSDSLRTSTEAQPSSSDASPFNNAESAFQPYALLTRDAVPALGLALHLSEEKRARFAADVHRALEQARIRTERIGNQNGWRAWISW